MVKCRLCCHGDEMIQEQSPCLEAVAEAVYLWLPDGVLGEENKEVPLSLDERLKVILALSLSCTVASMKSGGLV